MKIYHLKACFIDQYCQIHFFLQLLMYRVMCFGALHSPVCVTTAS
jgi:hypothetical protein